MSEFFSNSDPDVIFSEIVNALLGEGCKFKVSDYQYKINSSFPGENSRVYVTIRISKVNSSVHCVEFDRIQVN